MHSPKLGDNLSKVYPLWPHYLFDDPYRVRIFISEEFVSDTITFTASYEGKSDKINLNVAATFSLNEQKSHMEDANSKHVLLS
jgi:hypothetical protein